ncbi:MAG: hypothetical protein NC085_08595, partial [Muribaculaceae bacterium]|nr:hypothetical protein [Muribaculaceae bacterium]
MNIIGKFAAAVSERGIPCHSEFSDYPITVLQKPVCAFVGVKKLTVSGSEKVPTVQVRITLQGSEKRVDGAFLTETAENVIVPAVKGCGENISKTEISEVKQNVKTGLLYCEIIFEITPPEGEEESPEVPIELDFAAFKGIKIFVEEYSFTRAALTAETALIGGETALSFGGGSTVKIKLKGAAAAEDETAFVTALLDGLLTSGEEFSLAYGG